MSKPFKYILAIAVLLIFCQLQAPAQCAMCKQAAATSMRSNPHSMARSLNSGILYLMAVPYLLIAFIFRKQLYVFFRKVLRKPIEQQVD